MSDKTIGTILKELREEHDCSKAALAGLTGLDEKRIDQWEMDLEEPTISECLLLSSFYGIDLSDMFVEFDEMVLVPQKAVEAFRQAARRNRFARRWYN